MKLAILNSSISRQNGGVSEVARRMAQEFSRQALGPIEVLGLRDEFSADDALAWAPLEPRLFAPRLGSYGYAPGFGPALDAFAPDLCHVHGLWLYPTLAARRSGPPYVISPHGMLDPWALANSRWKKRLAALLFERRNLESAACLHATCAAELRAIREYGLRNPVCVVHNAVDLPPARSAKAPALWEGAIPPERKVLLYLGRLHPKKGLPPLISGWAQVRRESSAALDWTLVLAGWGQGGHEAELRALTAGRGLAGSVHFAGPLFGEAKDAAYACADAVVLPSFSEGLPLVILEAWAARKPVLMTDACNLPQGFAAQAALRIAPESGDIARGIAALAEMSAEERRVMGERGRALVEAHFTWPRAAGEMRAAYEWILGGGSPPACVEA